MKRRTLRKARAKRFTRKTRSKHATRKTRKTGGATYRSILQQRQYGANVAKNAAQLADKVVLAWKRRMGIA